MWGAERLRQAYGSRILVAVRRGYALEPPALLAATVTGSLTAMFGQQGLLASPQRALLFAAVAVFATTFCFLPLLILKLLSTWRRYPPAATPIITIFLVIGAARLELIAELHRSLNLPSGLSADVRWPAGALQALMWLYMVSLFYDYRERFLAERSELLDQMVRVARQQQRQSRMSVALSEELARSVSARVAESVSTSRHMLSDALDLEDSRDALRRVAASLRSAIDEEIRPMSRTLWAEPGVARMQLTIGKLLRIGCYENGIPLVTSSIVAVALVVPIALSLPNPGQGLLLLIAQLVAAALVIEPSDAWIRPRLRHPALGFWSTIVLTSLAVAVPARFMVSFGWTSAQSLFWFRMSLVGSLLLFTLMSVAHGLAGTRESVLRRARESLTQAEIEARIRAGELLETNRRLARHLHSSLQGRLMAISLEVERAAEDGTSDAGRLALERLDTLLASPLVPAMQSRQVDLVHDLQRLAAEWSAISEVRLHIAPLDAQALELGELIIGIAEEAVANAVRHGNARLVIIDVRQEGTDVIVHVENDGHATNPSVAGLGSRWLDSVSPSNWTLTPRPGNAGMVLEVRLTARLPEGSLA